MIPDKIYIYDNEGGNSYSISPTDNAADKKHEIEFVRKDTMLKWAKEMKKETSGLISAAYAVMVNKIESL